MEAEVKDERKRKDMHERKNIGNTLDLKKVLA